MKVVVDTNVLVSGIFFAGAPGEIVQAWRDGHIEVAISEEILLEYQRVAEDLSTRYSGVDIGPILRILTIYADFIETCNCQVSVCEDPDDDKFIACALASRSRVIISGDKHLLKVSGYQGIKVYRPKDFTDLFLS